jgi:hypothetical protein
MVGIEFAIAVTCQNSRLESKSNTCLSAQVVTIAMLLVNVDVAIPTESSEACASVGSIVRTAIIVGFVPVVAFFAYGKIYVSISTDLARLAVR